MVQSLGDMAKDFIPSGISAGGGKVFIIWALGVVIVCGLLGFGVYWVWMYLKFNQTVKIFKKVGGTPMFIGTDKAAFLRQSFAGDMIFKTKKTKKLLPTPTIQMGKNEWWYYVREDQEWINFGLEDIDALMKKGGAYFVDFDMRMHRLGIEKNLKERLQKLGVWERYGGAIIGVIYIFVTVVALVVIFYQMSDLVDQIARLIAKSNELLQATAEAGGGASGVRPA